jgi:D-glycero-D-manno-heptose 1,7-bisphosphate phosphatase
MSKAAVFLDRDGTLVEECGYLDRLDHLTLFPWTTDALRLLKRAGFATVVITNQAAVGRGIIDEDFVHTVHREIDRRLEGTGASIDRYYYCPHFTESKIERYRQRCGCRKPAPGMIEQACREMDLDPARSFMVGDRWLDVACGRAAKTHAVLVRSGPHRAEPPEGVHADAILNNLMEAVGWILRESSRWSDA